MKFTMHVIDGQAGLIICASLIFYSLTIDNILNIIVLLILAGISIGMLSGNNGILKQARSAKKQTNDASTLEQIKIAALASISDKSEKIDEITLKKELKNNVSEITDNDITGNEKAGWQVKKENKMYVITPDGKVEEGFWEEVKDANGNITEIRRVDGTVTGLKIGDTIGYNPADGASVTEITSIEQVNGYGNQTIKLSEYAGTWRLLGVENGKLVLISSTIAGVKKTESDSAWLGDFYFMPVARVGYQNAEDELNRICSIYGKGKHAERARSINVEDINKITGYDPEHTGVNVNKATNEEIVAGKKFAEGQVDEYGNKVTYEWDKTEYPKYISSVASGNLTSSHKLFGFSWCYGKNWQTSDYTTTPGKICELTSDYYSYYPETLTTSNDTTQAVGLENNSVLRNMLFLDGRSSYWLASKCIWVRSDSTRFILRCVAGGKVVHCSLASSSGDMGTTSCGLRPLVMLTSDIRLKKDANEVWQFVN